SRSHGAPPSYRRRRLDDRALHGRCRLVAPVHHLSRPRRRQARRPPRVRLGRRGSPLRLGYATRARHDVPARRRPAAHRGRAGRGRPPGAVRADGESRARRGRRTPGRAPVDHRHCTSARSWPGPGPGTVTAADMTNEMTSTSLTETVKQVDAGVLNVGYAEAGPADGLAVLLLHGWPYDIHSYAEVAALLATEGYRSIVPYLRGYGTTRFRSEDAFRNGQQAALAVDAIALMDALEIDSAIVAGFDWGARTANILAAVWPERCRGHVSVSGYLIGSQEANRQPLPPEAELRWWYQFYFATERGRAGYEKYTREFAKLIW